MNELNSILDKFNPISLNEIDEVKLMNRIDRKYWFHISTLNALLEKITPHYDILEIDGNRLLEYQSTYFDTKENFMYVKHHNRKLNRYKVRRRTYITSGHEFFEIKKKTNKRRTVKQRIETDFANPEILANEAAFLSEKTPFKSEQLIKSLNNQFHRITLVHKEKKDRCTIDVRPRFWNEKGELHLDKLVIFELKKGRSLKGSPIIKIMRQLNIRQRGLSKYCTGRAFLDSTLKRNLFKPRLRYIEKNILN